MNQQWMLPDSVDSRFAGIMADLSSGISNQAERYERSEKITPAISVLGIGNPNPDKFCRFYFRHGLHTNQVDVVGALTGDDRMVEVIEPRQAGKTSSVAVACAINCETEGQDWNRSHAEPYRIGIFAPKLGQAQIDIERLKAWSRFTTDGQSLINWELTTNSKIVWRNGSEIVAYSASEQAENVGGTLNRMILDEAQNISDHVVSEVILPMGGATGARIAKVGTVRAIQNHFWRTWHEDPTSRKVWHHWLACQNYLTGGYREHAGRMISRYILDMMPIQVKEFYARHGIIPPVQDWMYPGQLEYGDFLTQYELRWLEQFGLFMTADEKASLFRGSHGILHHQAGFDDDLYAGVDFATGVEGDETAVVVWRRRALNKERVWAQTYSDLDMPEQKAELVNLFGKSGKFYGVKLIMGDVGGNGLGVIQDLNREANIPIQPVNFGANDPEIRGVSMNMKTSMFMDFKRECQMGQLRYGVLDSAATAEMAMEWRKGVRQWSALEQEVLPSGVNRKISAPESDHDDVCCADVLAVRAAKMGPQILRPGTGGRLGVLPHFLIPGGPGR